MTGGHASFEKVYLRLREKYYFPNMYPLVQAFCKTCQVCTQFNSRRGVAQPPLQPIFASQPFEILGIDLIGPLKETPRSHKYIVIFIDHLTRYCEAAPLQSKQATEVAQKLYEKVFVTHGSFSYLLSDNGSEFLNKVMTELYAILETKHLRTSNYHPQCNGATEKCNYSITSILAKFVEIVFSGSKIQFQILNLGVEEKEKKKKVKQK